jgi:glycosyltransferase involved in cell wall biosynthesis
VGNLAFLPNVQGLVHFAREAWPLVQKSLPGVSLSVVGLNPNQWTTNFIKDNGFLLFDNASSLEGHYADADIVIVPIPFGSGTRVKILEAMAFGRPIVTTSMGAEGLDLVHQKHAVIADRMEDFAAAIIDLSRDQALRSRLVDEAHEMYLNNYTYNAFQSAFSEMIHKSTAE